MKTKERALNLFLSPLLLSNNNITIILKNWTSNIPSNLPKTLKNAVIGTIIVKCNKTAIQNLLILIKMKILDIMILVQLF